MLHHELEMVYIRDMQGSRRIIIHNSQFFPKGGSGSQYEKKIYFLASLHIFCFRSNPLIEYIPGGQQLPGKISFKDIFEI